MNVKNAVSLLVCLVAISIAPTVQGFNVGVKGTKCNLDITKGELNDPCQSLYDGVCGGTHCKCPAGTHEDPGLKRCVPGEAPKTSVGGSQAGGGGDFDPFDDIIDSYPGGGKKTPSAPPAPPAVPPPQPQPPRQPQPQPPRQPQPQPPYNPNQPGYNPNQPGYNPNQPGYNPNQPGYNPNQPGYNPNQPGYNPNQPGYNPNQPGTKQPGGGHDPNVGEKAGGGVGGALGLLLIGAIIYFCCCKGGKHKDMMNKFGGGRFQGIPFIGGGQQAGPVGQMQMQQSAPVQQDPNFGSQHTYIPPGGAPQPDQGQYGAPQQPYPPPAGGYYPMVPGDPYAQQPGYAPYPPQQGGGQIPMQPPMQPPPGMPMQPPPGMHMEPPPGMPMPMPQNPPYPPQAAPYVATAPPEGFAPDGQQPPPYTPQYQPNAPPPQ